MTKSRKLSMYGAVAIAVLGVGAWGVSTLNGASTDIDPSRLAKVERGTMVKSVVATGKVEPITKVEIKSKANGIIEKLYVDVDTTVQPGQVLAELDKEMIAAALRESRANLQAEQAALTAAEAQLKKNEVEAESPDVEFTARALKRAETLSEQKLVAQSALDEARSAAEQAVNRRAAARAQLFVSQARIAEAQAKVAQAQAAVARAQESFDNATIKAPIRATVLSRDVEIGSPVSSILNLGSNATLVMTLGDIQQVFVRGKVDESDIGHVKLGQPAKITVETFKDKVFQGKVTQISPIGVEKDNVTNFEVKVSIDNPGHDLKANMTANAEIVLDEFPDSLLVPEAAVKYDAQKNATVELADAGAKNGRRSVPVKLGVSNGSKTQVLSGLKAGDRVVLPS